MLEFISWLFNIASLSPIFLEADITTLADYAIWWELFLGGACIGFLLTVNALFEAGINWLVDYLKAGYDVNAATLDLLWA